MSDNDTSQLELLAKIANAMETQAKILERLETKESGQDLHTKDPANFSTATPLHGAAGIFSTPGLERDIITAHMRPYGIGSSLPLIPSVDEDPRFGSLTGYTAVSGSEVTYACEDAPSGYVKGCNLTARFGLIRRDTQTIDIDKVMLRMNRGDFTDLVLRGQVLGLSKLEPGGLNQGQILDVVTMSEMVNTAVQAERVLGHQIWQGVTTVVNEFPGLDVQIATGQKDADTGTTCPALDSDVKDYNYALVGSSIVEYLGTLEWYLNNNARGMGLDPVKWVVVMNPNLWFELTAVWPCAYNTNKCTSAVTANSTVFIDGRENVAERDAMRNGMYIDINGTRYPVILDTGIYEKTNITNAQVPRGSYASTIYFVPLTITGGFPVLYRQYVDYRRAEPDRSLLKGLEEFFWTDDGVYSWAITNEKWCYKLHLKTEQRIILRTPQLAGRIDNVRYAPLQHLRDSDPSSSYFKDGGVSLRSGLTAPYAVWTTRA